jgi:predicted nucleotidyltransferase
MMNALSESCSRLLISIFEKYDLIQEVILFGSRAKNTHTERSDIDLAIRNSKIDRHVLGKLKLEIDNSDIPYLVDIQIAEEIKNQHLIDHINRIGKLIYKKNTAIEPKSIA